VALPSPLTRPVTELLRLPGRTVPVPGWFPLVVEAVHPALSIANSSVRTRVNGMLMDLDLSEYVQRRIHYHCHETPEARWVRRLLRPGDRVLDVGANVGFFTLLFAHAVGPAGRVLAMEPVPDNIRVLEANLALNDVTWVEVRPVAAGDHDGEIWLGLDHPDPNETGVSGHYTEGGARDAIRVPVVRVDDALPAGGPRLRLIKVDVEGAEPRVLAGMARTLETNPPDALLMELNPAALERQGFTVQDMVGPLRRAGYDLRGVTALGRTGGPVRPREHRPRAASPRGGGRIEMVIRGLRGADPLETLVAIRPGAAAP
jgi:FkbM family methyltransferase